MELHKVTHIKATHAFLNCWSPILHTWVVLVWCLQDATEASAYTWLFPSGGFGALQSLLFYEVVWFGDNMAALVEKQDCAIHLCGLFLFYVLLIKYHVYLIFRIEFEIKIAGILGKPTDQRVFVKKRSCIGLLYHSHNIKIVNVHFLSILVKVPMLQIGTVAIWPRMFKSDVKHKQTNNHFLKKRSFHHYAKNGLYQHK